MIYLKHEIKIAFGLTITSDQKYDNNASQSLSKMPIFVGVK